MTLLLERDDPESELHRALARARDGAGGVALVAGEAGMGKTSLVGGFLSRAAGRPRVLFGACDPIETPRPLGPLIDAASDVDPDLATRLAAGMPRAAAFAAALEFVEREGSTTVFVLEDMHWADEATLDLFTFLGRRLDHRRTLLVATFRSDEVDTRHPLRVRLADVHQYVTARVDLEPLSVAAIERLVAEIGDESTDRIDVESVRRNTGGNPFFVTELLAAGPIHGDDTVPVSVRDAVLARVSRLPTDARSVLDAASIVPGGIEPWLLRSIADEPGRDVPTGLDICTERGLLRRRPNNELEFRHELARLAVEDVVEPGRRRQLHGRALDALRRTDGPVDHARLAHHAIRADAGTAVVLHAPLAAAEAMRIGSAREASDLLAAALQYESLLDDRRRGELLQEYAEALTAVAKYTEALDATHRAIAAFERVGDVEAQAEALARCGGPLWGLARQPELEELLRRADALLGEHPAPSHAAAEVASTWCSTHMLARRPEEAEAAGQRALALARAIGDDRLVADSAIQSGIALCMAGDERGLERIHEGMRVARAAGLDEPVSHGHSQIGTGYGELRRYDIAIPALHEGIAFKDERELVARNMYDRAWLARCELEIGDWDAAGRRADDLIRNERCVGNTRLVVLCTLGWLRLRRGDPGVRPILDEALELGRIAQHVQRLWPAVACRAEHAWMQDRLDDEVPVLLEAMELAQGVGYLPAIEELSHWLALSKRESRIDAGTARTPFGLSAAGRWDLALDAWLEVGCPYEAAFCRFMIGDLDHLRAAHAGFSELGAVPMRDRTAERLRELGVRVPRGANRSTRENPFRLTDRELDVLALLPEGCTNAEIGERLHISTKTVGHHVSKVLTKLEVGGRAEAAVMAARLGLGGRRRSGSSPPADLVG